MTFQDLSQKYAIENQQSFYYIQLKTIIRNKINIRNNTLTPPQISEEIMQIGNDNKLISKLYKLLTKSDTLIHVPQTKWNQDISTPLTSQYWTDICNNIFAMTTNTNLQLIQYKIIHSLTSLNIKNIKWDLQPLTSAHSAPWVFLTIIFTQFGHVHQFTTFGQ